MKYIFIDESGDLGFSFDKGSTRYFTITFFICNAIDEVNIGRIMKKVRQKILKKKLRNTSEIKWNNSNDRIKKKVFEKLEDLDIEIFSIIMKKEKVYDYLKSKKHKLYNYLCNLIITECSLDGDFEMIIDKSKTKRSLRDDFDGYIRKNVGDRCTKLSIKHEDSKSSGGLQVLDFISGAIFSKYEFGNLEYYNKIEKRITLEKEFP